MIEIIYKEEKQEAVGNEACFHLPKNIRQIGDCKGKQKIYVEDYVYTYLKKLTAEAAAGKAAILLGQYNWAEGISYFFIRGALEITTGEITAEHLVFKEEVWKEVGQGMETYFPEQKILGWFLCVQGDMKENDERLLHTHLSHFGGNDKVLFRMEAGEKEEAFYIYDSGALKRLNGFYIYYEKNEMMQTYMIDHNPTARVEDTTQTADQAVSDFRKIVGEKQEKKELQNSAKSLAVGVTVCAAAAALVFGVNRLGEFIQQRSGTTGRELVAANAEITGQTGGKDAAGNKRQENGDLQEAPGGALTAPDGAAQAGDVGGSENSHTGQLTGEPEKPGTSQPTGEPENPGTRQPTGEPENPVIGQPTGQPENPGTSQPTGQPENPGTSQPTSGGPETIMMEYTVKRGDSLSKICEIYYGTLDRIKDICKLNGIVSEDLIYAGQKLLLPK